VRMVCAIALVAAAALMISCGSQTAPVSPELTALGTLEVTAELAAIPGAFPPNDMYDYAYVLKYRVLKVHRGQAPGGEIFVAHYNPLKPRSAVADDKSGKIGGQVELFRAGDVHRMALDQPVDQFFMGGIIDKYFGQPGVRYWAMWTNPGTK